MEWRAVLAGVVLALAACSDGDGAGESAPTPEDAPCEGKRETLRADVDGDGRPDLVWRDFVRRDGLEDLRVGVCTADVSTDVLAGGMGEGEFSAIDIDQDGRSEIVSGGTTVFQAISEIIVFHDGQLVSVPDPYVVVGPLRFTDVDGELVPSVTEQWGCDDFDDDGTRDLVLVSAMRQSGGAAVHFEAYRIVGATAEQIGARDQELDHMPDVGERLVPSC